MAQAQPSSSYQFDDDEELYLESEDDDNLVSDELGGPVQWPEEEALRVGRNFASMSNFIPYARVAIEDLRICLRASRKLLRQRDEPYTPDHLVPLQCAHLLASALHWSVSSTDRIYKLDPQVHQCPSRLCKLVIEYTLFVPVLLSRIQGGDVNNTSTVEGGIIIPCTMTLQHLLIPSSDLHMLFVQPNALEALLGSGYNTRLQAMALLTYPGEPQADVEDLNLNSTQAFLTDLFCRVGGLASLAEVVEKLSPSSLASLQHILALVCEMDTDVLHAASQAGEGKFMHNHVLSLQQVLNTKCNALLRQIQTDTECLSERERTFSMLSRVFESMYFARCNLGHHAPAVRLEVNKDVSEMQRAFVLRMLRSTNFNNLLSAAREAHRMLSRAVDLSAIDEMEALKTADAWLSEHQVIQTLFKANLHQRQYADLVLSILQVLTRFGMIRTEHLDMLWAVTEAEGTFDVVKANVYAMIQDLAANLATDLLEVLFKKFEVLATGRSMSDSVRLLDLLKKLATSNSAKPQGPGSTSVTAERLLSLIWKLTVPTDTAPEMLAADAIADVLRAYGVQGHMLYCKQYLGRCCQELQLHHNVVTALRVLRRLLALYELVEQEQVTAASMQPIEGVGSSAVSGTLCQSVVAELDAEYDLQKLLVHNTLSFQAEARAMLQGRPSSAQQRQGNSFKCGPVLPGYGKYHYGTVLHEYLQTISYVASKQKSYYDQSWAEQLLDALVMRPVLPIDSELGLQWVADGASPQHTEFLSHTTKAALLDSRITALPVASLSLPAWLVFQQYFIKVNLEEKMLLLPEVTEGGMVTHPTTQGLKHMQVLSEEGLHGRDFMWRASLEADHADVAQQAAELLIQVYIRGSKGTPHEARATATLIRLCVDACMQSAQLLAGIDDPAQWSSLAGAPVPASSTGREGVTPAAATLDNAGAGLQASMAIEEPSHAVRTVQRCLFLMNQAAETGQLPSLPLQASHQATAPAANIELDIQLPAGSPGAAQQPRRIRQSVNLVDMVGTLRRWLARELHVEPQYIRLLCSGVEWKNDAHLLRQVLARPDHQWRPPLLQVLNSPVPNSYSAPGGDYAARWQATAIAQLAQEPHLYHMLLFMADQPQWPQLCKHAASLQQQLPTCSEVQAALKDALSLPPERAHSLLRGLLLQGSNRAAKNHEPAQSSGLQGSAAAPFLPARLTYWLQVLRALVSPPNMLSQQLAEQDTAMAISSPTSTAWRSSPQPSSLPIPDDVKARVNTLSACLSVLQDMLACAALAAQAPQADTACGLVRQHQVLSLHNELVQLLSQLCSNKELLMVMQNAVKTHGAAPRPQPLDQRLMHSPSPSLGTVGNPGLSTPTGALQALSVAGQETDADSSATDRAAGAGAVAVVAAFAPAPVQSISTQACDMEGLVSANDAVGGSHTQYASAVSVEMEGPQACGEGGAVQPTATPVETGAPSMSAPPAQQQQQPQSSGMVLLGLLLHTCCQAVQLASSAYSTFFQQPDHMISAASGAAEALSNGSIDQAITELFAIMTEAASAVRDGLSALTKLLNHLPDLCSTFFTHPRSPLLVSELLLCPHSDMVRATAQRVLRDICLPSSGASCAEASSTCYAWLLRQLLECRSRVTQSHAGGLAACKEYAMLLQEVVTLLPKMQQLRDNNPAGTPGPFELASQLLEQEVAALHACLAPVQQAIGRYDMIPENPGPGFTYLSLATPAGQQELEGRLKLVACLMRALDRSGDGDSQQHELIQVLFRGYLFPESVLLLASGSGDPVTDASPWLSHGASGWCATDQGARQAAFDLLADLMSSSSTNMACGIAEVLHLHASRTGPPIRGVGHLRKGEVLENLREAGAYCGLRNGGATCYMNAVIQQLFMQPQVRKLLLAATPSSRDVHEQDDNEYLFGQLQQLMAMLALSCSSSIRPDFFWEAIKDYDGQPLDIKEHQDAYEFFTRLQDSVDSNLRTSGQPCALASVFGGKFVQQIISKEGPHRSEREEEFYQISVDVKGKGTLQNSLASYVQGELMEGENAWLCEELGRKVAATRRMAIKSLPHTLVIHLKRFEYDHMANQRYKVRERFEFPATLDMYPYTAEALAASDKPPAPCNPHSSTQPGADPAAQQPVSQEEVMASPGSADANQVRPGMADSGTTDMTEDSMDSSTGADSEATENIAKRPSHAKYTYELRGVVVHSGSAFAGHYYSFIQERPHSCTLPDGRVMTQTKPGHWFKFDDKNVSPWDPAQLDEQCFGGPISGSMGGAAAPSNGSMSLDGTNSGALPDRAYSAFLLFYDRVDDSSCVEETPVPTFIPANPYMGASPAAAVHNRQAGTGQSAAGAHPAEAAAAAAGQPMEGVACRPAGHHDKEEPSHSEDVPTPYNMPFDLYSQVMHTNLDLLRRARAFEKEYLLCMRKVCDLRLERSVRSGRKARRTRLLDGSGSDATMGSQDACLSPEAGSAAQDAAAQREQERHGAIQAVVKLSLAYMLHVSAYVPHQWADYWNLLDQWAGLLQRLMSESNESLVALRAMVTVLCEDALYVCDLLANRNSLLKNKAGAWVIQKIIDPLQVRLALAGQQACASEMYFDAADGDAGPDAGGPSMQTDGTYNPKDIPVVVLHAELLTQLALRPIQEHFRLVLQHQNQPRFAKGSKGRGPNLAETPFHRHDFFFRMLGHAVSLLSPGVALLDRQWPVCVVEAVKVTATALLGDYILSGSNLEWEMEEVLTVAISCLVQILCWVDRRQAVFPLNEPRVSNPENPDLYPCKQSRHNPYRQVSEDACYIAAATDQEGGPLGVKHVRMNITLDRKVLRILSCLDRHQENLLVKVLLYRKGLVVRDNNLQLLRLLCWNDGGFTLGLLAMWFHFVQSEDNDGWDTEAHTLDVLLATCDALFAIPDQLDQARRHACLYLDKQLHDYPDPPPGIVAMLQARDPDLVMLVPLAWAMLPFVTDHEEMFGVWRRVYGQQERHPYSSLLKVLLDTRLEIPIVQVRHWPVEEMREVRFRDRVERFLVGIHQLRQCHYKEQMRIQQQLRGQTYPTVHAQVQRQQQVPQQQQQQQQQQARQQAAPQRATAQVVVTVEEAGPSQQPVVRMPSDAGEQVQPRQEQPQHVQVQVQVAAVKDASQSSSLSQVEEERGKGDREGGGQVLVQDIVQERQESQEV